MLMNLFVACHICSIFRFKNKFNVLEQYYMIYLDYIMDFIGILAHG